MPGWPRRVRDRRRSAGGRREPVPGWARAVEGGGARSQRRRGFAPAGSGARAGSRRRGADAGEDPAPPRGGRRGARHTGFNALSGEASVGTRSARGSTTLRYSRYGGEFKLLKAEGPPAGGTEGGGPERKLSDDRLQVASEYLLGGLRLETKAQWQRHWLSEVS